MTTTTTGTTAIPPTTSRMGVGLTTATTMARSSPVAGRATVHTAVPAPMRLTTPPRAFTRAVPTGTAPRGARTSDRRTTPGPAITPPAPAAQTPTDRGDVAS